MANLTLKENISLLVYAFWISAVAILTPIFPLMMTVGLLISVDTVFGAWAAIKRNERFSSNGLSRFITKMCVYQTVIITLFFYEKHITGDLLPIMKIAASMLSVVEVISILENAGIIIDKPVFKFLIEKLSSKSKKFGEGEK